MNKQTIFSHLPTSKFKYMDKSYVVYRKPYNDQFGGGNFYFVTHSSIPSYVGVVKWGDCRFGGNLHQILPHTSLSQLIESGITIGNSYLPKWWAGESASRKGCFLHVTKLMKCFVGMVERNCLSHQTK